VRQGAAIFLEVLEAERSAARARLEDIRSVVAFDEAANRLFRAIGAAPPER
jgi:outer membrane protein TolC